MRRKPGRKRCVHDGRSVKASRCQNEQVTGAGWPSAARDGCVHEANVGTEKLGGARGDAFRLGHADGAHAGPDGARGKLGCASPASPHYVRGRQHGQATTPRLRTASWGRWGLLRPVVLPALPKQMASSPMRSSRKPD